MLSFECIKNEKSVYFLLTSAEEGFFDNGKWSSGRVLNGDERSMSGFGQYAEVRHYIYCKETTDEKEG